MSITFVTLHAYCLSHMLLIPLLLQFISAVNRIRILQQIIDFLGVLKEDKVLNFSFLFNSKKESKCF